MILSLPSFRRRGRPDAEEALRAGGEGIIPTGFPEAGPAAAPAPAQAADLGIKAVKFTFDLDGGTLDGETGKVIKWFVPGATVKLPAAPVKDDGTFAGWETMVNGEKKVFEAGERFTVTSVQNFIALWDVA